jgi:hypothetical protein
MTADCSFRSVQCAASREAQFDTRSLDLPFSISAQLSARLSFFFRFHQFHQLTLSVLTPHSSPCFPIDVYFDLSSNDESVYAQCSTLPPSACSFLLGEI